jgi:CDGSH-type Zn-finger protein
LINDNNCRITITKNGPYIVSGNVPMEEKIIVGGEDGNEYVEGRSFPLKGQYALCRCGHSKNMPYCDGEHTRRYFDGSETASREPYLNRAEVFAGPAITLTDEEDLCAFARFCHIRQGSVWELTEDSGNPESKEGAIKTACDCPAGRLVAWDNETGQPIEPYYQPSIVILQDPSRNCSGPLWVRGGIPIEASDGAVYEVRNRVTLCRCGKSENKPFCDANHVSAEFSDNLNDDFQGN